MKKIVNLFVLSVLTMAFVLALSSCGGVSERRKFTGVMGEEWYSSQEEALTAYIENELCSETGERYEFSSYEKTGTLTMGELSSIGISDNSKTDGEKGVLTYKKADDELLYRSEIYILEEDEEYTYCSILPWEDTPLCKSYYDFITDSQQYQNVTINVTTTAVLNHEGYRTTTTTTLKAFYTEGGIYINYERTDFSVGESNSQFIEFWGVRSEDGIKMYTVGKNGSFIEITDKILPILNNSIENLTPIGLLNEYDHTIFMCGEKTFYLKESAKEELKMRFLQEIFGTTDGEVYALNTDIVIENCRILTMTETANAKSGKETISTITEAVYTNYGKTQVTVPSELLTVEEQIDE